MNFFLYENFIICIMKNDILKNVGHHTVTKKEKKEKEERNSGHNSNFWVNYPFNESLINLLIKNSRSIVY